MSADYNWFEAWGIVMSNMPRALMPALADLSSALQVVIACIVLGFAGRLLTRGQLIAEFNVLIGAGFALVVFTFISSLTELPLYFAQGLVIATAVWGAWLACRENSLRWHSIKESAVVRTSICAVPLLVVLLPAILWQSDTLNSWVPNYQYIAQHHQLPMFGQKYLNATANSLVYFPLLGYFATFWHISPKILMHLNIAFYVLMLSVFARLLVADPSRLFSLKSAKPSWMHCALLIPIWLFYNHHFPIIFSSYADLTTSIVFAVSAYVCMTIDKSLPNHERYMQVLALILITLMLTLVKASGIVLVLLWYATFLLISTCIRLSPAGQVQKTGQGLGLFALMLTGIFMAWVIIQYFVGTQVTDDTQIPVYVSPRFMDYLPQLAEMVRDRAGVVFPQMLVQLLSSPVMVFNYIAIFYLALRAFRRRETDKIAVMLYTAALIIIGYNFIRAFIFMTIMTDEVTSVQRYNYHLFYLCAIVLLLAIRSGHVISGKLDAWFVLLGKFRVRNLILAQIVLLVLAFPLLRADARERKWFMHDLAQQIGGVIQDGRLRIAPVIPEGRALHYAVLLRGLVVVSNPNIDVDRMTLKDPKVVVNPDTTRDVPIGTAEKFHLQAGEYLIEFCRKSSAATQNPTVQLFRHEGNERFTFVQEWVLPLFRDSKIQICGQ